MEDAHTTLLHLSDSMGKPSDPNYGKKGQTGEKRISFFAVFDGHGGDEVAKYAGEHLHHIVASQEEFSKGDYETALKNGFLNIDVTLKKDPSVTAHSAGCTAVCALITDTGDVFVSNAGDSRCVLSSNGQAVPLSFDHKPTLNEESQRIYAAGGFVSMGRVNGNLALSRAFGDFEFKVNNRFPPEKQAVTAFPDIIKRHITDEDEFLILACDGIWDCLTNERAVQIVRSHIARGVDLGDICEIMMMQCLASDVEINAVGADNMTIMIVALLFGKTKEEWYDMVAKRVKDSAGSLPNSSNWLNGSHVSDDNENSMDLDELKAAESDIDSEHSSQQSPMNLGKLISDDEDLIEPKADSLDKDLKAAQQPSDLSEKVEDENTVSTPKELDDDAEIVKGK